MFGETKTTTATIDLDQKVDIRARQAPLRETYERLPGAAMTTDHARATSSRVAPTQPLYGEIAFGDLNNTNLLIALHKGVGGKSDLPVPGDLFSAAIASCLDSAIRAIANHLGVRLSELEVSVESDVDLRGTLRMGNTVPVGFQDVRVDVQIAAEGDVPEAHLDAIVAAAEASCVVIQTLRNPPTLSIERSRRNA